MDNTTVTLVTLRDLRKWMISERAESQDDMEIWIDDNTAKGKQRQQWHSGAMCAFGEAIERIDSVIIATLDSLEE